MRTTNNIELRIATTARAKQDVLALRKAVYVGTENRISEVADFQQTFDRWDEQARYIVAYDEGTPVGTVKVIPDSEAGLPCAEFVDLAAVRARGLPVEFGHLIVLPGQRGQGIGMLLMREAFRFSVHEFRATHIVADLFLDKRDTSTFYRKLGFEVLHGPYRDPRFLGAPESLLMIVDIDRTVRMAAEPDSPVNQLLDFFLADKPKPTIAAEPRQLAGSK